MLYFFYQFHFNFSSTILIEKYDQEKVNFNLKISRCFREKSPLLLHTIFNVHVTFPLILV